MAQSEESPHTTRRRVWRFVFGCLGVVLVVGLWPLKGYEIDDEEFVRALGVTYLGASAWGDSVEPAEFSSVFGETARHGREFFEGSESRRRAEMHTADSELEVVAGLGVLGFRERSSGNVFTLVQLRNVVYFVDVFDASLSEGRAQEEIARECLAAIRDGIEREIPGVTTFYNPPARQLWINTVQPLLYELELKRAAADGNLWEEFEESP